MHEKSIYPSVIERVAQRRGGLPVFDRLDSRRTAHIVVDLQNGFMAPGAVAEIGEAREVVPVVNRISEAVRAAGGLVVYIQNTFDEEAIRTWSVFFDHFCSPARRARGDTCVPFAAMRGQRVATDGSAKAQIDDARGSKE